MQRSQQSFTCNYYFNATFSFSVKKGMCEVLFWFCFLRNEEWLSFLIVAKAVTIVSFYVKLKLILPQCLVISTIIDYLSSSHGKVICYPGYGEQSPLSGPGKLFCLGKPRDTKAFVSAPLKQDSKWGSAAFSERNSIVK